MKFNLDPFNLTSLHKLNTCNLLIELNYSCVFMLFIRVVHKQNHSAEYEEQFILWLG